MAQTTLGMSAKNAKVWYSLDGSSFVEMSGSATSVSVSGGARVSGEAYTASGDAAYITVGKREPYEITFAGIYSETTGDPEFFEALASEYEAGTPITMRWAPSGYDATNEKRFTTGDTAGNVTLNSDGVAYIIAWNYPSLDFSSGDPIIVEFTVKCSTIVTEDSA